MDEHAKRQALYAQTASVLPYNKAAAEAIRAPAANFSSQKPARAHQPVEEKDDEEAVQPQVPPVGVVILPEVVGGCTHFRLGWLTMHQLQELRQKKTADKI